MSRLLRYPSEDFNERRFSVCCGLKILFICTSTCPSEQVEAKEYVKIWKVYMEARSREKYGRSTGEVREKYGRSTGEVCVFPEF